jgi:hypothetical protein
VKTAVAGDGERRRRPALQRAWPSAAAPVSSAAKGERSTAGRKGDRWVREEGRRRWELGEGGGGHGDRVGEFLGPVGGFALVWFGLLTQIWSASRPMDSNFGGIYSTVLLLN